MELIPYSPDDPVQLAAAYGLRRRASVCDSPWERLGSQYRYAMQLRHGETGEPPQCFGAVAGGKLVGLAELYTSVWDNRDMAWMELWVDPGHRRRGYGTALLSALVATAGRTQRNLITVDAWDTPSARAFARAVGWPVSSVEAIRRLHPRRFPAAHWDALYAEATAHAADYELLRIAGASPGHLLAPLGAVTEAINDAPLDDLEWERERYPAERIRQYEQANLAAGHRLYRIIARHRPSNELAAHTVVLVNADDPTVAVQHDTAVVPAHRGRRLGLLVKAAMLRWLADTEPAITTIDTGNAASNSHMIAINEQLGFELVAHQLYFQRRFPTAA